MVESRPVLWSWHKRRCHLKPRRIDRAAHLGVVSRIALDDVLAAPEPAHQAAALGVQRPIWDGSVRGGHVAQRTTGHVSGYTQNLMKRYLGISEVAERTGLSPNTIKAYSQIPGRLPKPDAMTGRVKGWLPETIDRWIKQR